MIELPYSLVIEATKQLRGECGPRQVKDCRIALCHGTGGTLEVSGALSELCTKRSGRSASHGWSMPR